MNLKKQIYAPVKAGGILYKIENGETLICIIHRPSHDDWCLPKGHVDEGESLQETAIRETGEETGYEGEITEFINKVEYAWEDDNRKFFCTVYFFLLECVGKSSLRFFAEEVDKVEWVSIDEALERLTYEDSKESLEKVKEMLKASC